MKEWELGICVGDSRSPPLWQLEFAMRQPASPRWRCGTRIGKQVQQRKAIIYHILRTAGHTRPDTPLLPAHAQAACATISAGRIVQEAKANGRVKSSVVSLDKLSKQLMKDEMEVSRFEEDVFGWPKLACQANGNPRGRRSAS